MHIYKEHNICAHEYYYLSFLNSRRNIYIRIKILYNNMLTERTEQLVYTICIQFHTCEIAIDWPI